MSIKYLLQPFFVPVSTIKLFKLRSFEYFKVSFIDSCLKLNSIEIVYITAFYSLCWHSVIKYTDICSYEPTTCVISNWRPSPIDSIFRHWGS